MSATPWPAAIFDAPLLRGLDARGRRELTASGHLRALAPGDRVYREGDRGQALFVVADGVVTISGTPRGDARAVELRRVTAGESFGEESVIGASFRGDAAAVGVARVCELPCALLLRCLERSEGADAAHREERRIRRRAAAELLATSAFTREILPRDVEMVLDALVFRRIERGEAVYEPGEPAEHLWLVVDGMVQLQREEDGRQRVRAYLLRGDFFGDEEVVRRNLRAERAVASGPSLLAGIPAQLARTLSDRAPGLLARVRRVATPDDEGREPVTNASQTDTQLAFLDLYRLDVARSLLVIDLDACVRCGNCASSCASLHGTARLVRRGDVIVTSLGGAEPAPLLLPTSCQHCEHPACMLDCPTGAIGRDPAGDVFIRESLCTGCGACAKACPWDNIDIVPRPPGAAHAMVAVKCDLCKGHASPACVEHCPTSAIARIEPREDLPDVAKLLRHRAEPRTRELARRVPVVVISLFATLALALVFAGLHRRGVLAPHRGVGVALGVGTLLTFLALGAYGPMKRAVAWRMRGQGPARKLGVSRLNREVRVHEVLGLVAFAASIGHGGASWSGRGGAAALALHLTTALGVAVAAGYALVPRWLSRVERRAGLHEDIAVRKEELQSRMFAKLSGKSELVKKLFERVLVPYSRAALGPLALLMRRRDLRAEERALRARIDALLDGRGQERTAGLDPLIEDAVELRALGLQRILSHVVRGVLPLHLAVAAAALVLVLLHVLAVLLR